MIDWGTTVSLGGGNGTPLQYSCLENPMDGGAWWAAVHGVAKGSQNSNPKTQNTLHLTTVLCRPEHLLKL